MIDPDDVQLQIKKKARRRLVGAVAFAGFAALVLPMVMDQEPAAPAQEVEIRIPGQDDKPFNPTLAVAPPAPQEAPAPVPPVVPPTVPPVAAPAAPVAAPAPVPAPQPPAQPTPAQPVAKVIETVPGNGDMKPAARPEPKPEPKPETKPAPKPEPKAEPKPAKVDEAQRAAAILAGKSPDAPAPAANGASGPHVVLIGAFTNEANVKNIKAKLGELGIKVYTEPLDSPQGKKTRVRAGPFPSRDAAEKALEKMKRIGVSGVVAAK